VSLDRKGRLTLAALRRLPVHALSRAAGRLAALRLPGPLQRVVIRGFARLVGVDWSEVRDPLRDFTSLQEFFTRRLADGVRRLDPAPDALVSPCDGTWGATGCVERGTLLQLKGRPYALDALLGGEGAAKPFEGGDYATLYLAPKDYHRFHVPLDARVLRASYLPGSLWPVNRIGVEGINGLFAENERICIWLESVQRPGEQLCVVAVGATLVGKVHLDFDRDLTTNVRRGVRNDRRYTDPARIERGAPLGRFEFGSTLVLIATPGGFRLEPRAPGRRTRLGRRIGAVLPVP